MLNLLLNDPCEHPGFGCWQLWRRNAYSCTKCSTDCTSLQMAKCRKGCGKKEQRWSQWQLTLSSVSCCLKSSSSSESQSGNWYILIPYCSISSRIYRETHNRENTDFQEERLSLFAHRETNEFYWKRSALPWFSFSWPRWGWVCLLWPRREQC